MKKEALNEKRLHRGSDKPCTVRGALRAKNKKRKKKKKKKKKKTPQTNEKCIYDLGKTIFNLNYIIMIMNERDYKKIILSSKSY